MLDMRHTDKYYYKPIDKKTNYVKRCVAIPGDTLEIKNGFVWINGKQNDLPDRARIQFSYNIEFKRQLAGADLYRILQKYDITDGLGFDSQNQVYIIPAATAENVANLKNHPDVASVTVRKDTEGNQVSGIFPEDASYNWNNDFFGPLYMPKAGETIQLTVENLPLYKHVITHYEHHKISVNGNQILIDGQVASNYTFKKDYFWMMGDNRHNSQDSRVWGMVPHDHVIGKPVFKWMSIKGINDGIKNWSIRWDRVFTTVGGEGKPRSFFIPFLVVLALWFGYSSWRKKKKQA